MSNMRVLRHKMEINTIDTKLSAEVELKEFEPRLKYGWFH